MKKAIFGIVVGLLVALAFIATPKVFALLLIASMAFWIVSFLKWVMK